jgi:thiamine pyrophosphokinase
VIIHPICGFKKVPDFNFSIFVIMKSTCKVKLKGHKFDLKQASEYFNTDIFTISEIEDEYFISSDTFKDTRDTNVVKSLAAPYIEKVNAILKLKLHV